MMPLWTDSVRAEDRKSRHRKGQLPVNVIINSNTELQVVLQCAIVQP